MNTPPRSNLAEIRRFRVTHALRAVEDALALLRDESGQGIDIAALERVRADLRLASRAAEATR